jgi:hypothetical protein
MRGSLLLLRYVVAEDGTFWGEDAYCLRYE